MKTLGFNGQKNIIAPAVRRERERLELSQAQLASRLQVMGITIDQQAISKIERAARIVTDYELWALAEVFGLSPDQLFDKMS